MAAPAFGVLITYLDRANEIAALGHDLGVRIVQLHGDISRNEPNTLKAPDPGLTIIKILFVGSHEDKALEAMLGALSPVCRCLHRPTL